MLNEFKLQNIPKAGEITIAIIIASFPLTTILHGSTYWKNSE